MDLCAATPDDEMFLLELLNTTPVIDGVATDALSDLASAAPWLTEHGVPPTAAEWAAAITARTTLQEVVRGAQDPSALGSLVGGIRLEPVAGAGGLRWEAVGPAIGATRAVLAWDGLRVASPGRLRPCANTECRLFLIDRSKPNNARWCSMASCGNRMKARRHYQRSRSADDA